MLSYLRVRIALNRHRDSIRFDLKVPSTQREEQCEVVVGVGTDNFVLSSPWLSVLLPALHTRISGSDSKTEGTKRRSNGPYV